MVVGDIEVMANGVGVSTCIDVVKLSLESFLDTTFGLPYILYVTLCTFYAINEIAACTIDFGFSPV
jgi:hypothetical protein